MSWKCQIQRSPEQHVDGYNGVTVGEVLGLQCQGEPVEIQNKNQVGFVPPKGAPLAYKILEVKDARNNGGEFLFTTYLAPQKDWSGLQLTDGAVVWDVEIAGEPVVSVLPQDSADPPVPYGPYGPFLLNWPVWLLLLLIPVVILLFLPVRFIWVRVKRSRSLKAALEKRGVRSGAVAGSTGEDRGVSPLPAFHKAQRHIVKSLFAFRSGTSEERGQVITRMRESLSDFLLLEFRVMVKEELPLREEKLLKSQLKSSAASQLIKDLKMVLTELGRAGNDLQNVSVSQAQRLLELTRVLVLHLEEAHKGKRSAHGVA